MATKNGDPREQTVELSNSDRRRESAIFNWQAYARIVVRKHGIAPPDPGFDSLSIEEIEALTQVLRDLAHLPPG